MKRRRTEGDNFSVDSDMEGPAVSRLSGIVSGEIGDAQEGSREESRAEGLASIENACRVDAQMSELFARVDDPDPLRRIELLLDEILKMRFDLETSDAPAARKDSRGNYLSGIANRLRELL